MNGNSVGTRSGGVDLRGWLARISAASGPLESGADAGTPAENAGPQTHPVNRRMMPAATEAKAPGLTCSPRPGTASGCPRRAPCPAAARGLRCPAARSIGRGSRLRHRGHFS